MNKIISFNICGVCNYSCEYCSQGKYHTGELLKNEIKRFIDFFSKLGVDWEIKISGGEPFYYRYFDYFIKKISRYNIKISVVTNFSFPLSKYLKFIKISGNNLRTLSISLHRSGVNWKDFLDKSIKLKDALSDYQRASLVVNCVVQKENIDEMPDIASAFREKGIKFYPQLLRIKGKTIEYDDRENEIIKMISDIKDPGIINSGFSMKGRLCYSGINYFITSYTGECFTCYPGKRDGSGYLGNILDNSFKFRDTPSNCKYDYCPCTVPINRGIIE